MVRVAKAMGKVCHVRVWEMDLQPQSQSMLNTGIT